MNFSSGDGTLRRGLPYGAVPQPPDYEGEQGLIGIFLCGSISQKFEKICGWMNLNNKSQVFSFLSQDALLANRLTPQVSTRFEIPMDSGDPPVLDLTGFQFVVTRGTAYCFLPSMVDLRPVNPNDNKFRLGIRRRRTNQHKTKQIFSSQ